MHIKLNISPSLLGICILPLLYNVYEFHLQWRTIFEMPNNIVYFTKNIYRGDRDMMHFIFLDFLLKERAIMNNSKIMLRLSTGE